MVREVRKVVIVGGRAVMGRGVGELLGDLAECYS